MVVGIDRELGPRLHGAADVVVVEIEARRVGVDLQGRPCPDRFRDDGVHVDVVRGTLADHASGGVKQDVDVRVLD